MAPLLQWFAGLSWFANLFLGIGAAYYSYKLIKLTGGFRAWWLIIGFTIVFVVNSFFSVSYAVITQGGVGASSTANVIGVSVLDIILSLLSSLLLFSAMFGLHSVFKRMQKKQANPA